MDEPAFIECRQWLAVLGTLSTVVVAATKEDARVLAYDRFAASGHRARSARVRPATAADVARHEELLLQQRRRPVAV